MTVWATRADQVDLRGPNPHDLARSPREPPFRTAGRPKMRPQAQPEPRRADEPSSAGGRRARTALATVVFRATKAARPVRRCLRRGPARPRSGSCRWEGGVPGSARHAGRAHVRDGITFLPRRRPGRAARGGGRRPWPGALTAAALMLGAIVTISATLSRGTAPADWKTPG